MHRSKHSPSSTRQSLSIPFTSPAPQVHKLCGQGAATGVRFMDPGGRQLASAGADGRLLLTDRRARAAAAACASAGVSLTALDAHEDGAWLTAGTAGAGIAAHS